jgi:tryptophanyl-tRNA synthetase
MPEVILSGMRPTGRLHFGHLEGALNNYLQLQASGADCFFMLADWHALSSEYRNPEGIARYTTELLLDWLAAGIDPNQAAVFVQSQVPEHLELFVILSMITPLPWVERCPSFKEQQAELKEKDLATYGFLGYPVLQAADILLYRATQVPVGQDQLPHLEMTREIARRFNAFYGELFPEPAALLTRASKVPGLDTRKMSKSYANALFIAETSEELERKIKHMYTDPQKLRANTPGHPDQCVVLAFYKLYQSAEAPGIEAECRAGERGCMACKKGLQPLLEAIVAPIRERRQSWTDRPEALDEILASGRERARKRAGETMGLLKERFHWRQA